MLLRSTTKPPILGVMTKHHISEAFRIDFVHKSMLLRSNAKSPFFSIRGRFDQTSFFIREVIVPPSKLIVTNICFPKFFFLFFKLEGVNYEGGRSNQKSSFMRGVIVPPSKLIVNNFFFSPSCFFIYKGGFIIKGGVLLLLSIIITIIIRRRPAARPTRRLRRPRPSISYYIILSHLILSYMMLDVVIINTNTHVYIYIYTYIYLFIYLFIYIVPACIYIYI